LKIDKACLAMNDERLNRLETKQDDVRFVGDNTVCHSVELPGGFPVIHCWQWHRAAESDLTRTRTHDVTYDMTVITV